MATAAKQNVGVNKVAQALKGEGAPIGAMVFWSLGDNIEVKQDDLEAMFQTEKLDTNKWLPPKIRAATAFSKALILTRREAKGYMVRPILESQDAHVVGIVKETADKATVDLDYAVECKVKFDKTNESVSLSTAHPVGEMIRTHYKKLVDYYITRDVMRMLVCNIGGRWGGCGMDSLMLRPSGGLYFVPQRYLPELVKHQNIVNQLGESEMTVLEIYDNASTRKNLAAPAKRSLEEELHEIEAEIEEFATKSVREDTLKRRLASFKETKAKAEMYASMLSIKVDDINAGLAACTKRIMSLLNNVQTEKAEKQAAKDEKPATKPQAKKAKVQGAVKKQVKVEAEVKVVRKPEAKKPIKQAMKEAKAANEQRDKAEKQAAKKILVVKRDAKGREVAVA